MIDILHTETGNTEKDSLVKKYPDQILRFIDVIIGHNTVYFSQKIELETILDAIKSVWPEAENQTEYDNLKTFL